MKFDTLFRMVKRLIFDIFVFKGLNGNHNIIALYHARFLQLSYYWCPFLNVLARHTDNIVSRIKSALEIHVVAILCPELNLA